MLRKRHVHLLNCLTYSLLSLEYVPELIKYCAVPLATLAKLISSSTHTATYAYCLKTTGINSSKSRIRRSPPSLRIITILIIQSLCNCGILLDTYSKFDTVTSVPVACTEFSCVSTIQSCSSAGRSLSKAIRRVQLVCYSPIVLVRSQLVL